MQTLTATAHTHPTLNEWLDAHDPYFENPCRALAAGYTLAELAAAYEATFSSRAYAIEQMARDLAAYVGLK